jgi:glucose-6-phosphate isomerase
MKSIMELVSRFDPATGEIPGSVVVSRYLSDMRDCYQDTNAYEVALRGRDALLYTVASLEFGTGEGDLHYAIGRIMPGRIGSEYFMTKGHFHSWREAAELYLGLSGEGMMLLEDEFSSESLLLPLRPNQIVYVPGHTAHRTINVGSVPLTYFGIYPARAGHDYAAIGQRNFRKALVEREGQPTLVDRSELSRSP